jgi:hypothetical protein
MSIIAKEFQGRQSHLKIDDIVSVAQVARALWPEIASKQENRRSIHQV